MEIKKYSCLKNKILISVNGSKFSLAGFEYALNEIKNEKDYMYVIQIKKQKSKQSSF